jgi:hypothetical protein
MSPTTPSKQPSSSVHGTEFETFKDMLAATVTIISKARRRLCIYSQDLEHNVYGQAEVITALKQFAIQSRDGCAQIIVQNTTSARSRPHPLFELTQRLPSSFQFRMPVEPEDFQYPSVFIINDRDGYLFRQLGSRYEGNWSQALPGRNRQLSEEFERFWQRFQQCPEFQVLKL